VITNLENIFYSVEVLLTKAELIKFIESKIQSELLKIKNKIKKI